MRLLFVSILAFAAVAAQAREPRWPRPAPTPTSPAQAATAAANGASCSKQAPFYWEIGSATGKLAAGTVGGTTFTATTSMPIASASKVYYAAYVAQARKGVYSAADTKFLTFESGYGDLASCNGRDTVASCAARAPYTASSDGKFDYGGGHMEKHAALDPRLASMNAAAFTAEVNRMLGTSVKYGTPQPAGGITTTPTETAAFLRAVMTNKLELGKHLGEAAVPTKGALAVSSPVPEPWTYSRGHWVETDGTFTGAGAFGYYFWISADKKFYGIVARKASGGAWASVTCGRTIRQAFTK